MMAESMAMPAVEAPGKKLEMSADMRRYTSWRVGGQRTAFTILPTGKTCAPS